MIGPGGGRDLVSALVFGAGHVDGVEINPIIANDVMRDRFREFSGGIYTHPRVRIAVDDGRSFVRRAPDQYDVIQASLVDTWAATAAGAYTLTENSLYTVEAFNDYLDHLTDSGMLTITRWVFDGLRLVSLAQEVCEARGCSAADQLAIVRQKDVATFLFKKTPFTAGEIAQLRDDRRASCEFDVLYAPGPADSLGQLEHDWSPIPGSATTARLIRAPDRHAFYAAYPQDITPTTDDRPFYFHTTKLESQFQTAFGRSMLFGNGLSALLTLMAISASLVVLFVVGPLIAAGRRAERPRRVDGLARVLRCARRRLHADRGRGAAALRPAARPSGLFAHRHALFVAAWHRPGRRVEPALRRQRPAPHGRHRAGARRRPRLPDRSSSSRRS